MPIRKQLTKLAWGWLLTFWTCAAAAAQVTFGTDLTSIPPAAVAVSVLLAVIGGAAYTAQKMANPDGAIVSVAREIISDVLTSTVVGLLVFFFASYLGWHPLLQAGVITLSGYGGSRVLEPALSALIAWFTRTADKAP